MALAANGTVHRPLTFSTTFARSAASPAQFAVTTGDCELGTEAITVDNRQGRLRLVPRLVFRPAARPDERSVVAAARKRIRAEHGRSAGRW